MRVTEREKKISILHYSDEELAEKSDQVTIEEPLEVRVVYGPLERRKGKALSITMRTPGNDEELALGFLFSEGILSSINQVKQIEFCGPVPSGQEIPNTIRVELTEDTPFDVQGLQRHFYTTSSCGVCGKASLDALRHQQLKPIQSSFQMDAAMISKLPAVLRDHQDSFLRTGGIHAAALFDRDGQLVVLREDVGRHNALDKLIGRQLQARQLPVTDHALVVSGRASFELLQKSLTGGIPLFIAVGAPSSLAVDLAKEFGITLVGFASAQRFNVYSHASRIIN